MTTPFRLAALAGAVLLASLLLVATGCSSKRGATPAQTAPSAAAARVAAAAGNPDAGKAVFASTCIACHGTDARGLKGLGKNLVGSKFAKGLTDAQLVDFIKKGRDTTDPLNTTHVAMPPRGGNPALSDQDLANVVAYLRTLERAGP